MAALNVMLAQANRTVRMAVLLAAATGARRGEIVGLRWSDIDGDVLTIQRSMFKLPGGQLTAKTTKTGKARRVPLNPSLIAALHDYLAGNVEWCVLAGVEMVEAGPILAHLRADPTGATGFAPDWLSQEWERLCQRAGVAPFKLHGTRHLHITTLHDAGSTSAAIADRVGHASIQTTERHYTHALPAATLELAQTVEDAFGPLFIKVTER
jgi:integrase